MGEPNKGTASNELPTWFKQYIQEQQSQTAAAQEKERLRLADQENAALEARSRLIRNNNKPGKALPPLLEYYGEAEKLEPWLQQARAKMEVDYYGCTEYVKFWALNGALRGKALRRMEAWVREQGTPELADGNTFLRRLELIFKDPQAKERAQRKLDALRQGTKPFLEAFTEWQILLLESGGGSWPDDAKKVSLDRILSDELVRAMITVPSQPDFESYCSILQETDDRLRAYKTRATKSKDVAITGTSRPVWKSSRDLAPPVTEERKYHGQRPIREALDDRMDWEPTPAKIATTNTRRAKWASQEERENRRRTGRCIRCGASGHMIRECPYGKPQRPVTVDTIHKGKETPRNIEPELEDENSTTESEN